MHPPLLPEKHPICKDLIVALLNCHKEHSVAKFWGACNDIDFALAKCWGEEKKIMRAERMQKAKERHRQRVQVHQSRMEAAAAAAAAAAASSAPNGAAAATQ